MSMRRAVARPSGSGDLMDEVLAYEHSEALSDSQRVALRLHDAFLVRPGGLSAAARAEALEHFSRAQIVELALKFFFWSTNRPVVTLGVDAPHDENRLTSFHYGENGEYIVHATHD
jgi:alkylhydroperoxidase family enzyme